MHQASGLFPQVTEAESAYFKDMQRLRARCDHMEGQWKKLRERIATQCETLQEANISDSIKSIEPEIAQKANALLNHQAVVLKEIRSRMKKSDQQIASLARASA